MSASSESAEESLKSESVSEKKPYTVTLFYDKSAYDKCVEECIYDY